MKRTLSLILALLAAVLVFTVCISAAETFVNPVVNGADPFVFKDTDGTYYLYVTSGGTYGYRVYTSTNLVEWETRGYCLRRDNVYTDDTIVSETSGSKIYNFWAPEVIQEGDTYYMVYTAQEHIGIATADSPLGPFTNDKETNPYLLPDFKNIDGHFFKDDDGQLYLYFVSAGSFTYNGDTVTGGNNIWGGPFDLGTQTFAEGYPRLLITNDKKEGLFGVRDAVAEGPEILKHNGKYYLTYSASGYTDPAYAVCYAVSDSPVGPFTKYDGNPILRSANADRSKEGDYLYGTAHHCFTTSPDGTEMIIVYHAHRSDTPVITEGEIVKATLDLTDAYLTCEHNWARSGGSDENRTFKCSKCYATRTDKYEFVEERRICLDLAWFDENGVLHAGRNEDGVPTAVAQPLPSGGTLTRTEPVLAGTPFETLSTLPTVYLSQKDGNDENDGLTAKTALKTIDAAYAALPNGGTIVLTQTYQCSTVYTAPAVNGPVMIKGAFSAVPLAFRFIRLQSDTYFDDLVLLPQSSNSTIAAIECNNHNVTIGEGVSCQAQPTCNKFPYLVGGQWWSGNTSSSFEKFNQYTSLAQVTSDKAYTITVLSGTWNAVMDCSMKSTTIKEETAPNATLVVGEEVILHPAKASAPAAEISGSGAKLTFKAVANAAKYAIYKNGDLLGYSDTTTYVDTTYASGEEASYTVAGYVHGACIGDASAALTFTWSGDQDGDGDLDLGDVIALLKEMLTGDSDATLLDLLLLLKYSVR